MNNDDINLLVKETNYILVGVKEEFASLRDRVTRSEVKLDHTERSVSRIDVHLSDIDEKVDSISNLIARGVGGLKVGFWIGYALAGVAGFLGAHFWQVK